MNYCHICYIDTNVIKCDLCDEYCCEDHIYSTSDNTLRCSGCYYEKCHKCKNEANCTCEFCNILLLSLIHI